MSIFQKSNNKASSRQQINIKGVREGVLMLPGSHYRLILQASSINFELKSEDEQDAIIETYQNFLNSLTTSIQIVVRIREMDMQKYLDHFRTVVAGEKKKVHQERAKNYTEFVQSLVTANKILSRQFYIVVSRHDRDNVGFESVVEQLNLSSDIIAKGLSRLGVQTCQLDSLKVLDLFYTYYDPMQAKRQPLKNQTLQILSQSYL